MIVQTFEADLAKIAALAKVNTGEEDLKWKTRLQERVIEHNLRVMLKYYSRVKIERWFIPWR